MLLLIHGIKGVAEFTDFLEKKIENKYRLQPYSAYVCLFEFPLMSCLFVEAHHGYAKNHTKNNSLRFKKLKDFFPSGINVKEKASTTQNNLTFQSFLLSLVLGLLTLPVLSNLDPHAGAHAV